jgi:nucleotide-binding universal stress UspA family protein
VSDHNVEEGVINFALKVGADIIAIPTHGKKGLSHFLEGSIGEDVANHAKFPVITFKI